MTYFNEMEETVNGNIDACTIADYLNQFAEQERELEYYKYVISNYIKFVFIKEAKSQEKDYTEEILQHTEISIDLPDCVTEFYSSESYYKEMLEDAGWLRANPDEIRVYSYSPELSFYDMDSIVCSYTDDSVIEGALEGSENPIESYIRLVIVDFIKEMILSDCKTTMSEEYFSDHLEEICEDTFTYLSIPSCVCDLYPLEWVNEMFCASQAL